MPASGVPGASVPGVSSGLANWNVLRPRRRNPRRIGGSPLVLRSRESLTKSLIFINMAISPDLIEELEPGTETRVGVLEVFLLFANI
jgi:hypothetical protein